MDNCFIFSQTIRFFKKRACHEIMISIIYTAIGDVAKLVDALDLGSSAARCESSSLSVPTNLLKQLSKMAKVEDWCNGSMTVSKTVRQGSSP